MVKLNYSRNVVGCNINGNIFIHPELYKYPELYMAIVEHEKKHTDRITGRDVAIDILNDDLKGHKKEFYSFILKHPRTLLGYLPITKVGKWWGFDPEVFAVWLLFILIGYFVGVNL